MSRITFRKNSHRFSHPLYEVRRAKKLIAKLSWDGERYYWYRLNRHHSEPPHNTLCIPDSATTLEGCKAEIREFFK